MDKENTIMQEESKFEEDPNQVNDAVMDDNILELEMDYFSTPKFTSVIDRYYTRLYKRITPRAISTLLEKDEASVQSMSDSICLDQYYFIHSNKLVLFGLSSRHEAIINHSINAIISVSFDADKKKQRGDMKV